MKPFIKICCMASREEARLAISAGASAVGLVSAMPSGPGPIADSLIAEIAAVVPPPIATFLLTCRQDADSIIEQHAVCRTSTLQLVDSMAPAELEKLRARLPGIRLVQVIHVGGEESIDEARMIAPLRRRVAARLRQSETRGQGTGRHGPRARLAHQPAHSRRRGCSAVPRRRIECGKRRRGRGRRAATRRRRVQRCAYRWEARCREAARVRRGLM